MATIILQIYDFFSRLAKHEKEYYKKSNCIKVFQVFSASLSKDPPDLSSLVYFAPLLLVYFALLLLVFNAAQAVEIVEETSKKTK